MTLPLLHIVNYIFCTSADACSTHEEMPLRHITASAPGRPSPLAALSRSQTSAHYCIDQLGEASAAGLSVRRVRPEPSASIT